MSKESKTKRWVSNGSENLAESAKDSDARTILIVDDDPAVRNLLCELLSDRYNCRSAGSGDEALKILQSGPPALVISDIQMPRVSGLELIPLVLERSPDTVVMMISGNQTIDSAIEAIRAGAFDFIKKPFELDQVEVAVHRAVQHHLLLAGKRRHDEELEILVEERTNQLNHLAYYDALTGLPNRVRFEDELANAIHRSPHPGGLAVLVIAPDKFLDLRDSLGQGMSEDILRAFAERVTAAMGDAAVVARLDTAEFGVILPEATDPSVVVTIVDRLFARLAEVFRFPSHDIFVSAAIGIKMYHDGAEDAKTLIREAGIALSQARAAGSMSYEFFASDMHDRALHRLMLANELRHAADEGQLAVHYQPKIRMKDGAIPGFEALVRWNHPKRGFVPPGEFITIAEETGLITSIGKWVLRETCMQLRNWHEAGYPIHAAVNVSPVQFDNDLVQTVSDILSETGLAGNYLDLEVTESSVMANASLAVKTLNEMKALGVSVSIDDFGTGYSSLSHLKSLPVDVLKIDKSFINDITTDPDDASLVMSIINLAHNLGLTVVAEGVETEAQLQLLKLLRCDQWQGFLYSRPVPADEFYELLGAPRPAQA